MNSKNSSLFTLHSSLKKMCNNNRIHTQEVQTVFEPLGKPTPAMTVVEVAQAYFPCSDNLTAVKLLQAHLKAFPDVYDEVFWFLKQTGNQRWFGGGDVNLIIKTIGMPGRGFLHD